LCESRFLQSDLTAGDVPAVRFSAGASSGIPHPRHPDAARITRAHKLRQQPLETSGASTGPRFIFYGGQAVVGNFERVLPRGNNIVRVRPWFNRTVSTLHKKIPALAPWLCTGRMAGFKRLVCLTTCLLSEPFFFGADRERVGGWSLLRSPCGRSPGALDGELSSPGTRPRPVDRRYVELGDRLAASPEAARSLAPSDAAATGNDGRFTVNLAEIQYKALPADHRAATGQISVAYKRAALSSSKVRRTAAEARRGACSDLVSPRFPGPGGGLCAVALRGRTSYPAPSLPSIMPRHS
jgi:hypothetical protein